MWTGIRDLSRMKPLVEAGPSISGFIFSVILAT